MNNLLIVPVMSKLKFLQNPDLDTHTHMTCSYTVIASQRKYVFKDYCFSSVQAKICGVKRTPYQMITTGLYSVDYRITIATRCDLLLFAF